MSIDDPSPDAWVDSLCDEMHGRRPAWVTGGSLSRRGTRFLGRALVHSGASTAVEIGAASGFSTAVMAAVLDGGRCHARIDDPVRVVSFDASARWYVDPRRRTGEVAGELVPELLGLITFHAPATAADLPHFFEPDGIRFLFIDANHAHPWPTLDLMMALPLLAPGATVVLDDINLPLINPHFPGWGAHHLFYGVSTDKAEGAAHTDGTPTMGSLRVPEDKGGLGEELLKVLDRHEWQAEVAQAHVARARRAATTSS